MKTLQNYNTFKLEMAEKQLIIEIVLLTNEWYLRHTSEHSSREWPTLLHTLHGWYEVFEDKHFGQPSSYIIDGLPHWKKII